jgi:hypothetical protein
LAYDKPQRLGRPMYPYSAEPSFVSEKECTELTKIFPVEGFLILMVQIKLCLALIFQMRQR